MDLNSTGASASGKKPSKSKKTRNSGSQAQPRPKPKKTTQNRVHLDNQPSLPDRKKNGSNFMEFLRNKGRSTIKAIRNQDNYG